MQKFFDYELRFVPVHDRDLNLSCVRLHWGQPSSQNNSYEVYLRYQRHLYYRIIINGPYINIYITIPWYSRGFFVRDFLVAKNTVQILGWSQIHVPRGSRCFRSKPCRVIRGGCLITDLSFGVIFAPPGPGSREPHAGRYIFIIDLGGTCRGNQTNLSTVAKQVSTQ